LREGSRRICPPFSQTGEKEVCRFISVRTKPQPIFSPVHVTSVIGASETIELCIPSGDEGHLGPPRTSKSKDPVPSTNEKPVRPHRAIVCNASYRRKTSCHRKNRSRGTESSGNLFVCGGSSGNERSSLNGAFSGTGNVALLYLVPKRLRRYGDAPLATILSFRLLPPHTEQNLPEDSMTATPIVGGVTRGFLVNWACRTRCAEWTYRDSVRRGQGSIGFASTRRQGGPRHHSGCKLDCSESTDTLVNVDGEKIS